MRGTNDIKRRSEKTIMNIIITGGRGFVGSHLVDYVISKGHNVLVIDNESAPPVGNKNKDADYFKECVSAIKYASSFEPDAVVHLGEYSRVEASFTNSLFAMKNISGNLPYVLDLCRQTNCKLIYAGSSTKFGDAVSPYSIAKAANTEIVKQYCDMFELDYAITYFYNAYGLGERPEGEYSTVIEKFIQAKLNSESVTVNGDGEQFRNFTHIDDIISGLYAVIIKGQGDGFGIGSDESFTINQVVNMAGLEKTHILNTPGNRSIADLNTSKTKQIGWSANKSLADYIHQRIALHN